MFWFLIIFLYSLPPIDPHSIEEPTDPLSSEEPTDPLSSEEPTNPLSSEEPTDPLSSEEPTNPLSSEEPTDPLSSEEPTNPLSSEEPTDPLSSEEPTDPLSSEEPTDPLSSEEPLDSYSVKLTGNVLLHDKLVQHYLDYIKAQLTGGISKPPSNHCPVLPHLVQLRPPYNIRVKGELFFGEKLADVFTSIVNAALEKDKQTPSLHSSIESNIPELWELSKLNTETHQAPFSNTQELNKLPTFVYLPPDHSISQQIYGDHAHDQVNTIDV